MAYPSRAMLLAAAASLLAAPAFAQGDFLTAPKVVCTAVSSTSCDAPGQCKTEPATEQDKAELLIVDFGGKTVSLRKEGKLEKFADILEDKVSGELRHFVVGEAGGDEAEKVAATLGKDGKLTLILGKGGEKAEAACKPES